MFSLGLSLDEKNGFDEVFLPFCLGCLWDRDTLAEESKEGMDTVNPEAHFGREKYQLLAIQWLQKTPDDFELTVPGPMGHDLRGLPDEEVTKALEGFLGMIRLGAALESIDFFKVVDELLSMQSRRTLASLTGLRVEELQNNGRKSLHPWAQWVDFRDQGGPRPDIRKDIEAWYPVARAAAAKRQESRWAYLREGLSEGRHPDTDPDFWNAWKEPDFPTLPGSRLKDFFSLTYHPYLIWESIILVLILLWVISLVRRKRAARAELQHS